MLTRIKGTGTGVAPTVDLTFPFIDRSTVFGSVNGALVSLVWKTDNQVAFPAAVPSGQTWEVFRQTPTTPMVEFNDGAVLTDDDLNLAHLQHQYRDEELEDEIAEVGSGATYTDEDARDALGAALVAGSNVSISVNDAADAITISSIMDAEFIRDTIGTALVAGSNITLTPDDAGDTITVAATVPAQDPEFIRDTIASALVAGPNVTITDDDAANTITIAASGGGAGGGLADGNYGDITVSGAGTAMAINAGALGITELAAIGASSVVGNATGASAAPAALTGAQVTALLSPFTSAAKGLVPASGGGSTFLRADGAWVSIAQDSELTANALTFTDAGPGGSTWGPGATFNGSQAVVVSYSTVGAAPGVTPIIPISADFTAADGHNNGYLKFTGATARTGTFGNVTAGVAFTLVNRASAALVLSIAAGLYLNGATSTVTSASLAPGGKVVVFHEGGGVWAVDGSGVS